MASPRDAFLDGLRAVAIARVLALHLVQRLEHPLAAAFSFAMPSMPLMFFVSGALTARSLSKDGAGVRARFWRERARRLLVPFWAFAAVVVALCALAWAISGGAEHALPWRTAWAWVLPLVGPQASAAFDHLDWHLWFLSSLILLLASAPWTLALHRRAPFTGAAAFFVAGAALELAALPLPGVVRNTLLFGSAFQLGYAYADGRLRRVPPRALVLAALALAAWSAQHYAAHARGQMLHQSLLALVLLGLACVALWLALAERVRPLFERALVARRVRAVNARAYTIYLWGPAANELAWHCVRPSSAWEHLAGLALSIGALVVLVKLFGRFEELAARRGAVEPSHHGEPSHPGESAPRDARRAAA